MFFGIFDLDTHGSGENLSWWWGRKVVG